MASHLDICNIALARAGQGKIDGALDPPNIVETGEKEILCNLIYEPKRDLLLEMLPWPFAMRTVYLDYEDQIIDITAATQANPVEITAPGHAFRDYKNVEITEVEGMTDLNGNTYRINNVDATAGTFELEGIDGTGFTAWSSNGKVRLHPPESYEYEMLLPDDFIRDWQIVGSENAYEIQNHGIVTNDYALYLEYIGKNTTAAQYSSSFVWVLSRFLGVEIAQMLADSKALVREIEGEYERALLSASTLIALAGDPAKKAVREKARCRWQKAGGR